MAYVLRNLHMSYIEKHKCRKATSTTIPSKYFDYFVQDVTWLEGIKRAD